MVRDNETDLTAPARLRRFRKIIRDATGTDRSDAELTIYFLEFRKRADGPPWPRPNRVALEAEELARSVRALVDRELPNFAAGRLHRSPRHRSAVVAAIEPLRGALLAIEDARASAARLASEIADVDPTNETNLRQWAADVIAGYAALVFEELTDNPAKWSRRKRDPYVNMVRALFEEFQIKGRNGRIADVERPIKRATAALGGNSEKSG